jgi:hypothetical protein
MYGPPQDCKGKASERIDKSAAMYSAFEWRMCLLAMMSSAACLSLQVGRSLKTIIGIRLKARRCDRSFVFAVPVQTSVGKFKSVDVAPLLGFWLRLPRRSVMACNLVRSKERPMRCVPACSPWQPRRRS